MTTNSIYNNVNTIGAAYDALASVTAGVAGVTDIPKEKYSVAAQDLYAGRFDNIAISPEGYAYVNGESGENYDTYGNAGNPYGTDLVDAMTQTKIIEFVHDANARMLDTALEMIKDTVAGLGGHNVHNRAADYFTK